jgi:alkanesulfonate monooxygenase SsuD/methylene tetrahydromethanopterin reductase-like flavin-dependent oxidoreductase (luciferase family)
MKIGSLILVVPFRHPTRIAKVFGNLDSITDGRVILGVGAGWNPLEFETLGIERSSRGKRLEEGVEALKKLWTEDQVKYDGEYYSFEDVTIEPKPVQDPHPPIWFASFGPQVEEFNSLVEHVLHRVGRLGDGWVPMTYSTDAKSMTSANMLGTAWTKIAEAAKTHSRDPEDIEIVYSHYPFVMKDEEKEKERCKEALQWWFDGTYEEAKDVYLIGTPEEILEQIRQQTSELPRVDRYIFTPFTFDDEQLVRLSDEIIPKLR